MLAGAAREMSHCRVGLRLGDLDTKDVEGGGLRGERAWRANAISASCIYSIRGISARVLRSYPKLELYTIATPRIIFPKSRSFKPSLSPLSSAFITFPSLKDGGSRHLCEHFSFSCIMSSSRRWGSWEQHISAGHKLLYRRRRMVPVLQG